jgi:hypothetical protein
VTFSKAEEILMELGVTSPAEIDLPVIAYYLGATIKYSKLDGCEARIIGVGDSAIIRVRSDQFETSLSATSIRLLEARLAPLMVIAYGPFSRGWFKKSIDLRDDLTPPLEPHPETAAFNLLHSRGRTRSNAKVVDARLWFNRYDLDGVRICEDSIRTSDNQILVVLSPIDERLWRS